MQKYSYLYRDDILQFLPNLYMDDSTTGKETEEEALDFYLVCKSLMKEGGFNLRKWLSNSEFLQKKKKKMPNTRRNNLENLQTLIVMKITEIFG